MTITSIHQQWFSTLQDNKTLLGHWLKQSIRFNQSMFDLQVQLTDFSNSVHATFQSPDADDILSMDSGLLLESSMQHEPVATSIDKAMAEQPVLCCISRHNSKGATGLVETYYPILRAFPYKAVFPNKNLPAAETKLEHVGQSWSFGN